MTFLLRYANDFLIYFLSLMMLLDLTILNIKFGGIGIMSARSSRIAAKSSERGRSH
ncbi:MAG: hypothetical protein HC849_34390 [Oscillatoriales cyanobacterium RU_3_3]|nr:hypothetical protein [Microcoleus sp. SM1_3_4]NJM64079.1 hypothetical protein [Oscillatoriales cyanobacterium RU_3_3]